VGLIAQKPTEKQKNRKIISGKICLLMMNEMKMKKCDQVTRNTR
jgi:hypothetical protein